MTRVKETSDSLSHPVVETPHITVAPRRRTLADYSALAVATCGVGLIPLAPGTWGSAVGVGLYLLMRDATERAAASPAQRTTVALLVVILVTLAGTWAATRAEKLLGKKDPGAVVVDEVAGQLITFLFVPWDAGAWALMLGFVLFRVFDIWKPYPVRRLERLESGLGVMADDVLAGAYAATVMSLATSIYLSL